MSDCLEKLLSSKKYRDVCPDTIRRLWSVYQGRYKKEKDVDGAVREALHGITGAFLTPEEVSRCVWAMQNWLASGKSDAQLENILNKHASTRERLPLADMDALYAQLFAATGKTDRILDLACGINPIYLGARGLKATGVDISGSAVELVNAFQRLCDAPVEAVCADLLCPGGLPEAPFDLCLMFKVLPLLERQQTGAAQDVMRRVNARFLAVSFPTRTLGGRNVGMAAHYAHWMEAHLPPELEEIHRFEAGSELFFILRRRDA